MMDKEKVAHDLAILYELAMILSPDKEITPQELLANYEKSYKEYLSLIPE